MRRQLSVIALEKGTTMVDVAIGWLCCQPGVTPIIGARHPNEVAGVARRSLDLEPQHLTRLDQIGLEPSAE